MCWSWDYNLALSSDSDMILGKWGQGAGGSQKPSWELRVLLTAPLLGNFGKDHKTCLSQFAHLGNGNKREAASFETLQGAGCFAGCVPSVTFLHHHRVSGHLCVPERLSPHYTSMPGADRSETIA